MSFPIVTILTIAIFSVVLGGNFDQPQQPLSDSATGSSYIPPAPTYAPTTMASKAPAPVYQAPAPPTSECPTPSKAPGYPGAMKTEPAPASRGSPTASVNAYPDVHKAVLPTAIALVAVAVFVI
ncbi:unnamed protein product (mitochondrion) [Plasmodiophora brassicae]|uniref:Uncharacterized protein n=1 Tax=Plasmodiophora brassicae TaxID=37360 RepID=A0A3P3YMY6_PLABS|nr:unnamed protein product [Plasmodiophora brassicae]